MLGIEADFGAKKGSPPCKVNDRLSRFFRPETGAYSLLLEALKTAFITQIKISKMIKCVLLNAK